MTRAKKLDAQYEEEIEHAVFDLISLQMASHLLPRTTIQAAMRDVVRGAINRSISKAQIELLESAQIATQAVASLADAPGIKDNSSA